MTQEEQEDLTRQAMERAQKPRATEPTQTTQVEQPKVAEPKKPKTPKEIKPKLSKLQDNQRKLDDRVVTLNPWAGKTKKKFKKEFEFAESMDDVNLQKIIEILVYDQIEEDYQLTEMELQYLLVELKTMSIGKDIECDSSCPECGAKNKILTTTDIGIFVPGNLPAKFKKWNFKNVKRTEFIKAKNAIMNADDFDGLSTEADIELACKITKEDKTPKQMIDTIDDTPLKDLTEMMDEYVKNLAAFDLKIEQTCTSCQSEALFGVDVITGIFETLAK